MGEGEIVHTLDIFQAGFGENSRGISVIATAQLNIHFPIFVQSIAS